MEQKIKWINYLQIGFFSLVLLFLFSNCNKDELVKNDVVYINDTNHEILVKYRFEPFTIEPFGKYTFEQNILIDKKKDDPPYTTTINFYKLDVIVYDSVKCDTLKGFEIGPWNVANYQVDKVKKYHYELTYHFTEADYERAIDCE